MTIQFYDSIEELMEFKKVILSNGATIIHNDFVGRDGLPTDGKSGRLTIEIRNDSTKLTILDKEDPDKPKSKLKRILTRLRL